MTVRDEDEMTWDRPRADAGIPTIEPARAPDEDPSADEGDAPHAKETSALTRWLTPVLGPTGAGAVAWIVETALLLAAAFLLAQVVRTYVVQPYVIPTGSMEPTIAIQDRVLVNKFVYRFRDPRPGEVVVFTDPSGETPALIKRVIAVGGQTVELSEGSVVVDGQVLDEPYTHGKPSELGNVALPFTVPEGQIWLMGDNRVNSKDSRWIGAQPLTEVQGLAFATYWPPDRIGALR